jgi:hypothetical protein
MMIRAEFPVGLNHLFQFMDRLVAAIHVFLLKTWKKDPYVVPIALPSESSRIPMRRGIILEHQQLHRGSIMASSASARSGHLTVVVALTGAVQTLRRAAAKLRGLIPSALTDSYRPELHYMRGPGPKWRERHATGRPRLSYRA